MEYCCESVYEGRHRYGCSRKGKVERNGKFYCGTHDPVKVEEKNEKLAIALGKLNGKLNQQKETAPLRNAY